MRVKANRVQVDIFSSPCVNHSQVVQVQRGRGTVVPEERELCLRSLSLIWHTVSISDSSSEPIMGAASECPASPGLDNGLLSKSLCP